MKKLVRLYITRHGQTEYNLEHRAQGWSDSPLTENGREIAARLGRGLSGIKFDYVYSSSSKRAYDTARIVLDNMGADLPVSTDDNLKERGLGKLEGRVLGRSAWDAACAAADTAGHIGKLDLEALNDSYESIEILDGLPIEKPYNLEDFNEFKIRLKKALDDICEKAEGAQSNVFVVSHGLSILAMIYSITGDKYGKSFIDNASVTLIEYIDGVYYIRKVNDKSFIE